MKNTDEIYESKLASQCQGIAHCLTYNADENQAAAKHTLLEASHKLDSHAVRVHRKRDGLLVINARGNCAILICPQFQKKRGRANRKRCFPLKIMCADAVLAACCPPLVQATTDATCAPTAASQRPASRPMCCAPAA